MHEHFLKKRGIYYRTTDILPDRRTILFIHGLSGSSSAWMPYEDHFKERYNIASFDLRGHGRSKKYPRYKDYHFSRFVEDMRTLLDHLGISEVIMISHSFGSLIGLEFLKEYPHRISKAALLSPNFAVKRRPISRVIYPFFNIAHYFEAFPRTTRVGKHIDYSRYPMSGDWNIPRMMADIKNTGLDIYLYCSKQSYHFDHEAHLEKIHIPVLLIHGKKDTIFPFENATIMAKKIPEARLMLIDKADHILVLNHFDAITNELDPFLDEPAR